MTLHYLVFDASDEDSGNGSFDAMAFAAADRVPALLAEIGRVLAWAHRVFGPPGPLDEGGAWDFDLHGLAEPDTPVALAYEGAGRVVLVSGPPGAPTTVTFTLGGSPGFCQAFREVFGEVD